jgi:gamma-butyrobetaine dioxygenase
VSDPVRGGDQAAATLAEAPDFDSYPVLHAIKDASPFPGGVRVLWDDGLECRYHVFWLRENAPDPQTMHPVTREQALQLLDLPDDLEAVAAGTDAAGNLVVGWSTGDESRYHPGWLYAHSHGAGGHFSLPPRKLWDAALQEDLPRFHGPTVLQDESAFTDWAEALHIHGLAILEDLPRTPDVIEYVPARLGPLRTSNFGRVFDVRSRPDADSNAYTDLALPLHCDLTTREYQPGLQFLHCLENESTGGDSFLADGFHIARHLSETAPELFAALTRIPVCFANKARETDHRWEAPMIRLDEDGECEEVRWSPWLRAPVVLSFEETALLYRALRAAFAAAEDPHHRIKVRLRPGELLGFDNRRILHGRSGFNTSSGARWLRGCSVEREELVSRLRIIERSKRGHDTATAGNAD